MKSLVLVKRIDLEDPQYMKPKDDDHQTRDAIENLQAGNQELTDPRCRRTQSDKGNGETNNEHDGADDDGASETDFVAAAFQLIEGISRDDRKVTRNERKYTWR